MIQPTSMECANRGSFNFDESSNHFLGVKNLLILPLVIFLVGCATGSCVLTGTARQPIKPDAVKVYQTAPKNAESIAILNATANNLKINSCVEELKREAAKIGANGIVITAAEAHYFQGARVSAQAIVVPSAE